MLDYCSAKCNYTETYIKMIPETSAERRIGGFLPEADGETIA